MYNRYMQKSSEAKEYLGVQKMKLLQRKILVLVISSILISSIVVMVIAFFNYDHIIQSNSGQIMQLMCSEKRQTIDEKLLNIEHSVHEIYHFAVEQIEETKNLWQNEELYEDICPCGTDDDVCSHAVACR